MRFIERPGALKLAWSGSRLVTQGLEGVEVHDDEGDVLAARWAAESLIAANAAGIVTRRDDALLWRDAETFECVGRCKIAQPIARGAALSEDARFLSFRSPGIAQAWVFGQEGPICEPMPSSFPPSFLRLPSGHTGLMGPSPGYQDIVLFDCDEARVHRSFESQDASDFCHTDFARLGARHLWTFGCVWASSYECVIYDVSEWLEASERGSSRLPEVYRHSVTWDADDVLCLPPLPGDETCLFAKSVLFADLPEPGSEDALDCLEGAGVRGRKTYDELLALRASGHRSAMIVSEHVPGAQEVHKVFVRATPGESELDYISLGARGVLWRGEREAEWFDVSLGEWRGLGEHGCGRRGVTAYAPALDVVAFAPQRPDG